MNYVGLSLHLRSCFGTIMDENGAIMRQGKFSTTKENLEDFLEGIDEAIIAM